MNQKLIVLLINIVIGIYIAKKIYFEKTTTINLVLGTILILGVLLYILMSIFMYYRLKKHSKDDMDLIEEILDEMEKEEK